MTQNPETPAIGVDATVENRTSSVEAGASIPFEMLDRRSWGKG